MRAKGNKGTPKGACFRLPLSAKARLARKYWKGDLFMKNEDFIIKLIGGIVFIFLVYFFMIAFSILVWTISEWYTRLL